MWIPKRDQFEFWINTAKERGYFNESNRIVIAIDLSNILYQLIAETPNLINALNDIIPYLMDSILTTFRGIGAYRRYCVDLGLDPYVVLFADIGESKYHLSLYPDYKLHRHVRPDYIVESIPSLKKIYDEYGYNRNIKKAPDTHNDLISVGRLWARRYILDALRHIINFMPNTRCIVLDNMEADFIPFYLEHYKIKAGLYITNSADNDMLQNINQRHCIIHKRYNIITYRNIDKFIASHIIGDDVIVPSVSEYYCLYKAIAGDSADHVKGVRGYGKKKAVKVVQEFASHIKRHNIILYEDDDGSEDILEKYAKILPECKSLSTAFKKYGEDETVSTILLCLRLVDFDIISRTIRKQPAYKRVVDVIDMLIDDESYSDKDTFLSILDEMFAPVKEKMPNVNIPSEVCRTDNYWSNILANCFIGV